MNKPIESEDYNKFIINKHCNQIKKRELGFIDKEEDFIIDNISIIVQHCINNNNFKLFNEEQYNNIIYILNVMTNGRN